MNLAGHTIPTNMSYLVNDGILPSGTHRVQHLIFADLSEHFSNSMSLYKTFRQCPGVQEFAPHLGNEHGQGRVELELAANVRLVLDDVVYSPHLPRIPMAYDRVFLSLHKLLESGCTMEVDCYDQWIIRRNGNLLVFGTKSPSLLDPQIRVVLGPFVGDAQNLGVSRPLQNAVARNSPRDDERPPRELQAAILRATARDGAKASGPLQSQIGRLTAPIENKPAKSLSDAKNKATHKAGKNLSRPLQGNNASAKPRDAARKHWGNLAYRALPPAGKDTK